MVIDVAINAQSAGAGKTQMASAFREMETAAQASSANISRAQAAAYAEQEKALSAHNARMSELATQRFNAEQERFNAQVNSNIAAKQREYDEIRRMTETETRRNQQTAASNANANINGFYRQMGMSNNPADINAQTKSQASYNSRLLNMASKDIAQAEANIDKVLNGQKIADANRQLAQLTKTTSQSTGALGMWGEAFKGAFIGAIAGMTFSTIIGGITSLVSTIKDAAVQSVVLAGNFEQSTNSIAVFAGSTRLAKEELASLDDAARNTPGLELQGAEKGYQQLRALNFEAKLSKDLIIGIGKERLISGTDEANVQRVIVNLTQLSASTARAGMDIREIIHAIPTMRAAFIDAFGTVEPTKIKNLIDTNAPEFFRKLADSMNKTEIAAPGLNAAFTSLMNAFLEAGRAFGQPFLEPITGDVQDMTKYLNDNAKTWRHWGQEASDAIQGVLDMIKGAGSLFEGAGGLAGGTTVVKTGLRAGASLFTAGISDAIIAAGEHEQTIREAATKARQDAKFSTFGDENPKFMKEFAGRGFTVDFSGAQSDKEINRRDAAAEQQKTDLSKKAMEERIKVIREGTESQVAAVKNGLNVELAIRDAHLRNTTQEERTYQKEISGIKMSAIQKEIDLQTKGFQGELDAAKDGDDKRVEISAKANTVLGGLRSQLSIETANAAKADAELEKRILDERRQNYVEFINLEIRDAKTAADGIIFNIERQIEETGSGYEGLIQETQSTYEEVARLTMESYNSQLSDATLSVEKRANLEKQLGLELRDLAEQNREKMTLIEDRELKDRLDRIERFSQKAQASYARSADRIGMVGSSLGSSRIDTGYIKSLGDLLFGGDIDAQFAVLKKKLTDLTSQRDAIIKNGLPANADPAQARRTYDVITHAMDDQEQMIKDLDAAYSDQEKSVYRVAKAYEAGTASLEQFQAVQMDAFDSNSRLTVAKYSSEISKLNAEIGLMTNGKEKDDAMSKLDDTIAARANYQFETAQKRAEFYHQTVKGLTEDLAKLQSGDPSTLRQLNDRFRGEQLTSQVTAYQDIYKLQSEIAAGPYMASLDIEKAKLTDILELRQKETDAIISLNKSKLEIGQKLVYSKNQSDAKVAEFLAQQKGLTDIVSDAKINMLTTAYSGLDAVATRLTKSFGAAKDMVQSLISSLLKLALNWVFQKYFGIGSASAGGGGQRSGGGFSLPNFNIGGGGQQQGGGMGPLFSGSQGGGIFNFGGGGGTGSNPSIPVFGNMNTGDMPGVAGSPNPGGLLLPQAVGNASASAGQSALGGLFSPQGLASAAATMGVSAAIALATYALTTTSPLKGALTGGLVGLIAGFYNRTKLRRKEEIARNTAMLDAFSALDKLIADVRNDKIDGAGALDQADGIRKNYLDAMSQLKDKRTRETALRDVSRIDQKISDLRSAVGEQVARKERLELMVPTFAAGGPVSMGFQTGPGTSTSDSMMGYFPVAGTNARYSRSEYILDAETTSNIGVHQLDQLRASKGRTYSAMRAKMPTTNAYAGGGAPTAPASVTGSPSESGSPPMTLELSIQVGLSTESFVQVISSAISNGNGSRDQLQSIVTELKNQGNNELTQVIAKEVAKLLK